MFTRLKLVSVISILFLVACNNSHEEQGKGNSNIFQNLSTNDQEEQLEQPLESPLNELIENPEQAEGEESDTEKIVQNKEDQQKVLPEPVPPEELYESNQVEMEEFEVEDNLPFTNFKERWNAVTDANFSNLYIKNLKEASNDVGVTHTAVLNEYMELRIYTTGDFVQSIELITKGNINVAMMLTGWSQIINILHPELEIHDVDGFFHEIGVGPNGDLSELKMGTIPYYHISYTISKIDNGFVFQGSYN